MDTSQFTDRGKYVMLALDHRGSFKKFINPDNPDDVEKDHAVALKRSIIESVHDQMSGVLIDAEYGLPAYKGFNKPFILPMEASGYSEEEDERMTSLAYRVTELTDAGAQGAKLLLYFNPDVDSRRDQLEVAKQALQECKQHNVPLFLEIVTYVPGKSDNAVDRADLVTRSLQQFLDEDVIPDVFKLEYPGNEEACRQITEMLGETPWILLTRGEDFKTFTGQLKDAARQGAVGFLAGRALWQDIFTLPEDKRPQFFTETLPSRFKQICEVVYNA